VTTILAHGASKEGMGCRETYGAPRPFGQYVFRSMALSGKLRTKRGVIIIRRSVEPFAKVKAAEKTRSTCNG
jgi:hypothetical protein